MHRKVLSVFNLLPSLLSIILNGNLVYTCIYFWTSFSSIGLFLFHLFLCQYYTVLTIIVLYYILKSGKTLFLRFFWLFKVFCGLIQVLGFLNSVSKKKRVIEVILCVVLGFERTALHLINKHSVIWVTLLVLFAFSYFANRVLHIFAPVGMDCDPCIFTSCIAGMAGAHHYVQLYCLRWSLTNFLPRLASTCVSPDICFPSSWDYLCEPLCYSPEILIKIAFNLYIASVIWTSLIGWKEVFILVQYKY
jgi:hypothetical protein